MRAELKKRAFILVLLIWAGLGAIEASAQTAGKPLSWGDNSYGQLGSGVPNFRNSPTQVRGLTGISSIAAGGSHSLALGGDRSAFVFGSNLSGQLGTGSSASSRIPIEVTGFSDVRFLAGGWDHSLALRDDGTAWGWGSNAYGQLG